MRDGTRKERRTGQHAEEVCTVLRDRKNAAMTATARRTGPGQFQRWPPWTSRGSMEVSWWQPGGSPARRDWGATDLDEPRPIPGGPAHLLVRVYPARRRKTAQALDLPTTASFMLQVLMWVNFQGCVT